MNFFLYSELCLCYTNSNTQPADDVCIIEESCNVDNVLHDLSQVSVVTGLAHSDCS